MNRETCEVFIKLNWVSTNSMLIFTVPSGVCNCLVCDNGTRGKVGWRVSWDMTLHPLETKEKHHIPEECNAQVNMIMN
jgi:hypothetical protein